MPKVRIFSFVLLISQIYGYWKYFSTPLLDNLTFSITKNEIVHVFYQTNDSLEIPFLFWKTLYVSTNQKYLMKT